MKYSVPSLGLGQSMFEFELVSGFDGCCRLFAAVVMFTMTRTIARDMLDNLHGFIVTIIHNKIQISQKGYQHKPDNLHRQCAAITNEILANFN